MNTMRTAGLLPILTLAPIATAAAQPQSGQVERLPNILFIVSDDHGWGDLPSNWDKTEVRLPTLEALPAHPRLREEMVV